jgi:hypothetical protein
MHRFKVEQIEYFDELSKEELRGLLAVEAGGMVRDAVSWIVASGDMRANVSARAATIGFLFGYLSRDQAAEMGGCSPTMISKLRDKLCKELGIEQKYNQPIKDKG